MPDSPRLKYEDFYVGLSFYYFARPGETRIVTDVGRTHIMYITEAGHFNWIVRRNVETYRYYLAIHGDFR